MDISMHTRCLALQDAELAGVSFLEELCAVDQRYALLERENKDGSRFVDAGYPRVDSGRICDILAGDDSPSYGELVG
ncbi:hypothetical protein AMJ82_03745 [candidate division TA06 bacterium SM23_40]|uniref:Uncharacterized protein n=1 Tax=candidate division TA06 bacterium SM23_40 TaxID=1703774 RepID=A0A0S8GDF5_UNCT6|nr:MAG: hypothetical protein AMJ82_03745 [candidate division TA06 bacterium SM23_40]